MNREREKERERERDFHSCVISPLFLSSVDSSYLAPHMSNLMPGFEPAIDIDQQTDSNHDTALTLAAAGMIVMSNCRFLSTM